MAGAVIAPRRGDVYWVDWSPARGSEQAGRRPAVVISNDTMNDALTVVTVAAITTSIRDRNSPVALVLEQGRPLPQESCILAFHVMTVARDRLVKFAGRLCDDQIEELGQRLRNAWF